VPAAAREWNVDLLHAVGQAGVPPRVAGHDAYREPALLLAELHAPAGAEHERERHDAQETQRPGANPVGKHGFSEKRPGRPNVDSGSVHTAFERKPLRRRRMPDCEPPSIAQNSRAADTRSLAAATAA